MRAAIMSITSTAKRRRHVRLLAVIFLLAQEISILQASPQRGTSNEPASAGNTIREATSDPKYVFNGIYTSNSIYAMTFPPLLMRPELIASYAQVVAKTLPRRVDNRFETPKVTPMRTVSRKDDSVKFPTNRPTTSSSRPTAMVTSTTTTTTTTTSSPLLSRSKLDSFSLTAEDKRKCDLNFADCKQLNSYPTDIVEKLILENKVNKNLLVNEELIKPDVNTRFEGSGDDAYGNKKQFCSYKEDILYPQGGKNGNDEYRFIIQAPKFNITQGIRTETCVNEGDETCGGLKSYLPDTYQVVCVQKYAYKQFVTVSSSSPGTTTAAREPIKIPSCCVCMYMDKK